MRRPSIGLMLFVALIFVGAFLNLKFVLAILALIVVFVGIVEFRQSGSTMAIVSLALVLVLAIGYFNTNPLVAAGAAIYGIFKSFGITISVLATILMILLSSRFQNR